MRKFITVIIIGILFLQTCSLKISAADVNGVNSTVTGNTYTQDNNLLPSFVKVTNAANVSIQTVNKFISQAQSIIKENKKTSQASEFSQMLIANKEIYDYFYIDEANKDLYFYEDSSTSNPIAKIVNLDSTSLSNANTQQNSSNVYNQSLASLAPISGGMGAKVTVPSGNLLEARIKTDNNITQLNKNTGTTYTYVGFTGATEADAGLQYSPFNEFSKSGIQAWKPYLKVGSGDPWLTDTMLNGYDAVQYKNGYIPGEEVQVSFWKNYIHDNVRTTRLKLRGLAQCANSTCSSTSPTKLAVIMEKNGTGISNIDSYKILSTIADIKDPKTQKVITKASGTVSASVTNITVDGVSKTPTQAAKSANSSMSISSNNVTFNIK